MTVVNAPRNDLRLRMVVRAAGGLVIRRGADDGVRVVLVHRPRYDGWSFPKGKQRRGETLQAAALREVREETGFLCIPEHELGVTDYVDRRDRPKLVRYWAMRCVGGDFLPTDEVDAMAWLRPAEASVRLSHDHDRELLIASVPVLSGVLDRRDEAQSLSLG